MPSPCPSCNKMCSLEIDDDPQIESGPDLDGNSLSATVTINLKSGCCGEDMRSHTFDLEKDVEFPADFIVGQTDFEIDGEVSADEAQVKTPKGKRKGYKVELEATVEYTATDGEKKKLDFSITDEIAQSDMEEV